MFYSGNKAHPEIESYQTGKRNEPSPAWVQQARSAVPSLQLLFLIWKWAQSRSRSVHQNPWIWHTDKHTQWDTWSCTFVPLLHMHGHCENDTDCYDKRGSLGPTRVSRMAMRRYIIQLIKPGLPFSQHLWRKWKPRIAFVYLLMNPVITIQITQSKADIMPVFLDVLGWAADIPIHTDIV